MVEDFLFFYFLVIIRDNFKIMRNIQQVLLKRKHILFSYLDAILIYYYIVIGLQAEYAYQYVEKYWKKYHNPLTTTSLLPPISV